jgi:SAM-dependent methyltransferase
MDTVSFGEIRSSREELKYRLDQTPQILVRRKHVETLLKATESKFQYEQLGRRMMNSIQDSLKYHLSKHAYVKEDASPKEKAKRYGKRDGFEYIPFGWDELVEPLRTIREAYKKLEKYPSFLDVGCGPGIICLLARAMNFDSFGIEYVSKTAKIAKMFGNRIFNEDALKFDKYEKFDVIYYYSPLCNDLLEIEMEKRIEDQMKVGAWILPRRKQYDGTREDSRFKYHGDINAYQKVKDGPRTEPTEKAIAPTSKEEPEEDEDEEELEDDE